ncbi:MAG: hypothetical protein ACYTG2_10550 [Planctomycetota bacterium]|jgi:hypothetical protein
MDAGTVSWVLTIVVFGAVGWLIANWRSRPASPWTYVALVVLATAGYFVGVDTRLVEVGAFQVFLNWAIVSYCVGGCVGLLVCSRELRRIAKS